VIPSLLVAAQFGLIAVILAFGALPIHSMAAAVLGAGGALLGVWTLIYNRPGNFNIRPLPKSDGRLVTGGPYRWIRHPMYTTVMLVMASFAIAAPGLHPGWAALVALLAVLMTKAHLEERLLRTRFPAYAGYADGTHRFLPGVY
jgi:protein-S-isoprenylcysteine O-methyltransferase Ste14